MQLKISDPEREYLIEMLKSAQTELLHELHHTDTLEYKNLLKERTKLVESLLERLKKQS